MKIIGITGTIGAGKGTIVDYLIEKYKYKHYSVRGYLIKILKEKGLEINRDTMVSLANSLRAEHNPAYIIEELYKEAKKNNENAIIESIRTVGEINSLQQLENFILLAVDADPKVRYHRITKRASETDHISFETFLDNEKREMSSNDPNKQNLLKCIAMADVVLNNNTSFVELYKQIETKINN